MWFVSINIHQVPKNPEFGADAERIQKEELALISLPWNKISHIAS